MDVSGLLGDKVAAEVEPSPVLKAPGAPMATPENFDEQQQQQQQQPVVEEAVSAATVASTAAAAPTLKLNGQAVSLDASVGGGDADTSFETGAYQPNHTFYDEEDDDDDEGSKGPKRSLEEEIEQLDQTYHRQDSNHVLSASAASPTATPAAAAASSTARKRSRCGVCGTMVCSVLVAVGLVGVLFYVLYFSGLEHPYLEQARQHLTFLEPTRDFVAQQARLAASYLKK